MRRIVCLGSLFCVAAALSLWGPQARAENEPTRAKAEQVLRFEIEEGRNLNAFYRQGPVAAHMLLRSGTEPRILVAFPAGNSGVALWFAEQDRPARWELAKPIEAVTETDGSGRLLRGIEAEVIVEASELQVRRALLSSVRILRDYETSSVAPGEVATSPVTAGKRVGWSRDRLDGAPGYRLSLDVLAGELSGGGTSAVRISSAKDGRIRLRIRALTGETPLTPLDTPALLAASAGSDVRARNALAFLSYHEKFLAGSWRFNTYFGRDTLMSIRLLMSALPPAAVESGLLSVLERLAPNGEVAHEEDIGEFAVLRHRRDDDRVSDAPIYDYGMVDDDFMLAPVAVAYLLDRPADRARAAAFLSGTLGNGARAGDALARNFLWVVEQGGAFAAEPKLANLIGLKVGRSTGQWRDSENGLGGGRYPYDVNAVFVPAALRDIGRLVQSGLLDPYLTDRQRAALARASADAAIWSGSAPGFFEVSVPPDVARADLRRYASAIGVDERPALDVLGNGPVEFDALALDESGKPVRVVHSDAGFSFLFGSPSPAAIERSLAAMLRPFPAGLMTDIGLLVANPVFAGERNRETFGRGAYHGTVVWAWQQAVLIAGIDRQLARTDLSPALKSRLLAARRELWAAVSKTRDLRTSELWSWSFDDGRYQVAPFGATSADEDESNAAQLWSTVFLALDATPERCPRQEC